MNGFYRLSKAVILRNEYGFLHNRSYLAACPKLGQTRHLELLEYELLQHLSRPRSYAELDAFLIEAGRAPTEENHLARLLNDFEQLGMIESTSEFAAPIPLNVPVVQAREWRYRPASAPVSVVAQVPMAGELLGRLIAQCNALGVLALHLICDGAVREFLLQAAQYLVGLRIAVRLWLRPQQLMGVNIAHLVGLGDLSLGLEASWADQPLLKPLIKELAASGISHLVSFPVSVADDPTQISQIVHELLEGGVQTVHLTLTPSETTNLAELAHCLTLLHQLQNSQPAGKIQLFTRHWPLMQRNRYFEPRGKQLLEALDCRCSLGRIVHQSQKTSLIGTWLPKLDCRARISPVLPPNCCQAGLTSLAVDQAGMVYPCETAFGIAELAIGNLNQASLAGLWASERWKFFRGGWELYQLSGCFACRNYVSCAARRCRVHAMKTLNNRLAPMPMCVKCADELQLTRINLTQLLGDDLKRAEIPAEQEGEPGWN